MSDPDATIRDNARAADAIVVGRVVALGPPPPAWSGVFAAWQRVDYQIVRWLKPPAKEVPSPLIAVFHLVVSGAPTADPAVPRLRASIFYPGAELILFVREADSRWEVFDEHRGVLPNDTRWLHQVETAISETADPPPAAR
jgi:hypothetical protein